MFGRKVLIKRNPGMRLGLPNIISVVRLANDLLSNLNTRITSQRKRIIRRPGIICVVPVGSKPILMRASTS